MTRKAKKIIKKIKNPISKSFKLLKFYFLYLNRFTLKKTTNQKEIIIVFDGNFPHGGLVDRLKGIVSFYQVSKEIDAKFKIYFKKPFDLTHFLLPNEYDWSCDENDLSWNPFDTKVLYLMLNFDFNPLKYISSSNKKKFVIFCNIDYSKAIYSQNDVKANELQWGKSFNQLFKMSDLLKNELEKNVISENSIAFHTRFTTLFGDFKDSSKCLATNERKEEIKEILLNTILKISNEARISNSYVFSDSIEFLNFIKKNSSFIVIEGNPFHTDEDKKSENVQNHLKTFLDFFIISKCKKIYLLKTTDMYNSSFSRYATFVGNKDFKIVDC
jgi:hypothetical protein